MGAKIEFKGNTAFLQVNKSDISGDFKQSPSSQYFMICDTMYSSSGNNDHECAVVFTKHSVIYKKPLPDDSCALDFYLFDDGSSLIVLDNETMIRLDAEGKQIAKRAFHAEDACGMHGHCLYGIGTDDAGHTTLSIYNIESGEHIARTIPDIEYDDDEKEDMFSNDTEWELVGDNFIFVYENGIDCIAYDMDGNQITPSPSDVSRIHHKRTAHHKIIDAAATNTNISTQTAKQAKKKFPVWLIIVIAIIILTLIGKFVAE